MDDAITRFDGEFRFLSNFWLLPEPINIQGRPAATVEHAFQAFKAVRPEERLAILNAPTPGQAKRLGRAAKLRVDWDEVKDRVMLYLLREKFRQPKMRASLLATGERELIEGNTWGDRYWGVCNGTGQNKLGMLLMQVRNEERKKK